MLLLNKIYSKINRNFIDLFLYYIKFIQVNIKCKLKRGKSTKIVKKNLSVGGEGGCCYSSANEIK